MRSSLLTTAPRVRFALFVNRVLASIALLCTGITTTALADYRIAVVNIEKVLNESALGKKSRTALDERASGLRQEVQEKRARLQKREKELKDQKVTTDSPDSKQFREQVKEFNRFVSDSEDNLRQQFAASNRALTEQVLEVVRQVAKEKEFSIILDGSERTRSGVLFRQEQLDITSDVMERFP